MSKVEPSLKAARTRYRNSLISRLESADNIVKNQVSDSKYIDSVKVCRTALEFYCRGLEGYIDKIENAAAQSDEEFVRRVEDEDGPLIERGYQCQFELENIIKSTEEKTTKKNESMDNLPTMQNLSISTMSLIEMYYKQISSDNTSVQLPKLNLNSFNGNKMKWTEFWDAFESTIHNNKRLSGSEKLLYLMSKLDGEAKRAVKGFALSNMNYDLVIQILKERFGNKQEIINLHYNEIINAKRGMNNVESLRSLLDTVENHLRYIKALGEDTNQGMLVVIIKDKLPEKVLRQIELAKGSKVRWSVDILRHRLSEYVLAWERAETASTCNRDSTSHESIENIFENKTESKNTTRECTHQTWNKPVFQYRHETANDTCTVLPNEILVIQRKTTEMSKPKTASNSLQGTSIPETGVLRNKHHGIEKVNIDNKEDTADLDTRRSTGTTKYKVLRQTETADIQTPKTLASEEVERRTQLSKNRLYVVETEHVDTNMNSEEPATTGDNQSTVTAICNQTILSHDPDLSTQQMEKWAYRIPAKTLQLKDQTNTKSL